MVRKDDRASVLSVRPTLRKLRTQAQWVSERVSFLKASERHLEDVPSPKEKNQKDALAGRGTGLQTTKCKSQTSTKCRHFLPG